MADPVVVSATVQEFAGLRYYRCGRYFQRNGRRLHVAVWEAAHGPRPRGCGAVYRDGSAGHVGRTCSPNCYARLWRREARQRRAAHGD